MSNSIRATICVFDDGGPPEHFRGRVGTLIRQVPHERIELRFGFCGDPNDLHWVLGLLCPNSSFPERDELPGGVERLSWKSTLGFVVRAWLLTNNASLPAASCLLYHDRPLETEYVISWTGKTELAVGWWEALVPHLEEGMDYIGRATWHNYSPGEMEAIRTHSWYMGIPFSRRDGHPGVSYVPWGFTVIRSERLAEIAFPEHASRALADGSNCLSSDVLLGEIARQLGWRHVHHCQGIETK